MVDFFKFAFEVDALERKGGSLKTNTFSQTYTTHYLVQPHDQSRFKNLLREKLWRLSLLKETFKYSS